MIQRRNLDNSLIQWIMTQTNLGPGIGAIKYVAPATSATSQYRSQLEANGVSSVDIFTSLASAEDACVAYRNDIVLAMPGAFLETSELAWDKSNTHILGLSGPNTMGDYYEPGVVFYTTDTAVAGVINVTAPNVQFHNIAIQNAGANAACLWALYVNKYAGFYKNVSLMGMMETASAGEAAAAALYIGTDGHTPIFENCIIGQDVWSIRTAANSGVIYFAGSQPNDGIFRNSIIKSISNTATCAAITTLGSGTPIGRGWTFDNCHFQNFSTNGTMMNNVFYGYGAGAWQDVMIHNSMAQGYDEWTDQDNGNLLISMPGADLDGGLAQAPTATI